MNFCCRICWNISNTLRLMQELWRIAKPDAHMTIRIPHGSSDDAWEDPTHERAYFANSFGYFPSLFIGVGRLRLSRGLAG